MAWISNETNKKVKSVLEDLLSALNVDVDTEEYDREVKNAQTEMEDIISDEKDESYNEGVADGEERAIE